MGKVKDLLRRLSSKASEGWSGGGGGGPGEEVTCCVTRGIRLSNAGLNHYGGGHVMPLIRLNSTGLEYVSRCHWSASFLPPGVLRVPRS